MLSRSTRNMTQYSGKGCESILCSTRNATQYSAWGSDTFLNWEEIRRHFTALSSFKSVSYLWTVPATVLWVTCELFQWQYYDLCSSYEASEQYGKYRTCKLSDVVICKVSIILHLFHSFLYSHIPVMRLTHTCYHDPKGAPVHSLPRSEGNADALAAMIQEGHELTMTGKQR